MYMYFGRSGHPQELHETVILYLLEHTLNSLEYIFNRFYGFLRYSIYL
jgi:hypothetical protein